MRFGEGRRRRKIVDWRWEGKSIEKVKEFKYLEYRMTRNGRQEVHIKERGRKAMVVMRQVWGIREKKFRGDWKRGLKMFDSLVGSVLGYGAEIWGWKEREEVEIVQERYLRWMMGLDWKTPGYIVREEIKRDKMRKDG